MANTKNLKPWPKGVSGNPAGMVKGYIQAKNVYAKLLAGKMSIKEAGRKLKKTRREILLTKAFYDAVSSSNSASERTAARESILNRLEGKPVQPIGAAPDSVVNITVSPLQARLGKRND